MHDSIWSQLAGPATRRGGRPETATVLPELFIGEYPTHEDAVWLRDTLGVTAVICLQDDADLSRKGLEVARLKRAYEAAGMRFHRLPMADGDTGAMAARLDHAVGLLESLLNAGERVYLHCNAGMNRAPTIAVAYLHRCRGHSLAEACAAVKQVRPCVPYMSVLREHYARPRCGAAATENPVRSGARRQRKKNAE